MDTTRKPGLAIKILSNKISRHFACHLSRAVPGAVTGLQGRVLGFIREQSQTGDVFQKDIEDAFDIRRSTATGMLQLMIKNGLLTREPVSYDARLKKITLTDKALGIHDRIIREIDALEHRLMDGISEEELGAFYKTLEKLEQNLR